VKLQPAIVFLNVAFLALAAGAHAQAPTIHCTYREIVEHRTELAAVAWCTAPWSALTLDASRAVVVEHARNDGLVCTPVARATKHVACHGSVAANARPAVLLTTTSLCTPITIDFNVTKPFPNGAPVTVRALSC